MTRKNSTSTTIDECRFYHTLEHPTFGRVEGTWDLTGRFDDYVGRISVTGKRVLDIGTASGFLTWESEARGATVTSFDVETAEHLFMLPIRGRTWFRRCPFISGYDASAWRLGSSSHRSA